MYNLNEILEVTIREVFKQAGDMITESEIKNYVEYILDNSTLYGTDERWTSYKWSLKPISENIKGFSATSGRGNPDIGYNEFIAIKFTMLP